jgi:hypothetical protein
VSAVTTEDDRTAVAVAVVPDPGGAAIVTAGSEVPK